mmetsp:Transcript_7716/g.18291  ORF Transcript_7716/g.18291 Transcript_7716/m.18291 type:complete len:365 (+) Transcript_7716:1642-2736(+)
MLGQLRVGGGLSLGLGLGTTGSSLGGGDPGSCSCRGRTGGSDGRGSRRPDGRGRRRRGDETTGRADRLGGGGSRGGGGGSARLGGRRGGGLASRSQGVGHNLGGTLGDGLGHLPRRGGAHRMNSRSLGSTTGSGGGSSESLGPLGQGIGDGPSGLGRRGRTGSLLGTGGPSSHTLGRRRRKDASRPKTGRGLGLLGTAAPLGTTGGLALVGGPGGRTSTAPLATLGPGSLGCLGLGLGRIVFTDDATARARGGAGGLLLEEGTKVVERGRGTEGTKTIVEVTGRGHGSLGGRVRDFRCGQVADRLNVGVVSVGDSRRVVHVHQLVAEQVAAEQVGRRRGGGGIDGGPSVRGHDYSFGTSFSDCT